MSDHLSRYDFVVHVRYRKFSGSSNITSCQTDAALEFSWQSGGEKRVTYEGW